MQFTPDLLPSDVVGVTVWNRSDGRFEFRPGPIFATIVLGDEINRASPKTQSALLEAMAEGQVTVDNATYPLGPPFMVIATQNPIEHEGTYPLPESQLDRFLMRVSVGYPSRDAEIDVLDAHGDHTTLGDISAVVIGHRRARGSSPPRAPSTWPRASRRTWSTWPTPPAATRSSPSACRPAPRSASCASPGPGPRPTAGPTSCPTTSRRWPDPVLGHRLLATAEAQLQGISSADVLDEILRALPVPAAVASS